jgi:hypothetical protein
MRAKIKRDSAEPDTYVTRLQTKQAPIIMCFRFYDFAAMLHKIPKMAKEILNPAPDNRP